MRIVVSYDILYLFLCLYLCFDTKFLLCKRFLKQCMPKGVIFENYFSWMGI